MAVLVLLNILFIDAGLDNYRRCLSVSVCMGLKGVNPWCKLTSPRVRVEIWSVIFFAEAKQRRTTMKLVGSLHIFILDDVPKYFDLQPLEKCSIKLWEFSMPRFRASSLPGTCECRCPASSWGREGASRSLREG